MRDDCCRFDASILEEVIKEVIEKRLGNAEALMADNELDTHPPDRRTKSCPVFVVATRGSGADGPPAIFRSYHCEDYDADECTIWAAARCTTATPSFFKPMLVQIYPHPGQRFLDGGLGYNNPSLLAIAEAKRIWPKVKSASLVSIGTGWQKSVNFVSKNDSQAPKLLKLESRPNRFLRWSLGSLVVPRGKNIIKGSMALREITRHIVDMSTNSERVHQDLLRLSADPAQQFPYFRFNVQRGMDDIHLEEWKSMQRIEELTSRYMAEEDTEREKKKCAAILCTPPKVERM